MQSEIREYLDDVRSHLHLDPATEVRIMKELYGYFEDKVSDLQEEGFSQEEASDAAIKSFGRPRAIALRMYEAHSKGSWVEASLALLPHLLLAGLFLTHLWRHPLLAPIVFAAIICVTLCGWWHGKPSWLYPWIGYSLLALVIAGYIPLPVLKEAASFLMTGHGAFPNIGLLLLVLILFVLSLWIIARTSIRVIRRDWILASLMLVPVPVVVGWLVSLEAAGGLFSGSVDELYLSDVPMALALTILGMTSAVFIRLRQRVFKVGALVAIGSIALSMVVRSVWGDQGFLGLLVTSVFLLLLVLSPALLEARIGHGTRGEMWWEDGWIKHPSKKR